MVSNARKDFACYQCGHDRFEGMTETNGMIGERQVARARCLKCGRVAQLPKFVSVTGAYFPLSGEPAPPSPRPVTQTSREDMTPHRPPVLIDWSGLVAHYERKGQLSRTVRMFFRRRFWVPRKRVMFVSFVLGAAVTPVLIIPVLPDSLATFVVDYQTWIAAL